ncbi:hypothetical protein L1987_58429 [Smallanthus sonchifolius]|uniref:Uncharacterized protein n=1 Tax=Smallanthus sonchifolius TaxID=185202 RepID=A0ACB9DFQ5_9ASTR|nr:hypothetical protein L1987_58429 [Smallanthus sonchifolius]
MKKTKTSKAKHIICGLFLHFDSIQTGEADIIARTRRHHITVVPPRRCSAESLPYSNPLLRLLPHLKPSSEVIESICNCMEVYCSISTLSE